MTEPTSNIDDLNKPQIKNVLVKIDFWSALKLLIFLAILFLFYVLRDILILFLAAMVLSFILSPIVDFLEKRKWPRILATISIYLFVVLFIISIVLPLIPVLTQEINLLIQKLPNYYDSVNNYFKISNKSLTQITGDLINSWFSSLNTTTTGVFNILGTVVGWLFVMIMIFVMAFYMTLHKIFLKELFKKLIPAKYATNAGRMIELIQKDLSNWARGVLISALFVGVISFIGLSVIGIKFALFLGFFAAVCELIPWIGSWISAILAILVGFTQAPMYALFVAIFYIVIQQVQGNLITPKIMQRAIGIDPLFVIMAILIGGKLAGPLGIVLAVPTFTIIMIIFKEYWHFKKSVN
ncbi:MAG: AI-2E family transporter [Patescibacteria group bacterium]|nr:AI-2E family transporter [Patescibacteria group bacterium]MDD5121010.1 AI-2E family transporter [Patescibacteria group bacterium]MDD5221629.1 AI-2E family transporter [Patescibacteria group bacterium]MDD5396071.1 AI-2E family transporter [Patescibacteria group bacterium]